MAVVRVKLNQKIARHRGGFVDQYNGKTISAGKYDKTGSVEVERTPFVVNRLSSGELIEVTPVAAAVTPAVQGADGDVDVKFLEDVKVGKQEYKAGEQARVSAKLAENLRKQGKVE